MPTVGETETRQCMVEVTETERVQFGAEMAEHEVAIEVLKAERAALSARVRKHEKHRNRLGHILDNGKHEQSLECWWRRDETAREWYLQRPDTGETIETRPFSSRDMVHELPFDDGDVSGVIEVIGADVPGDVPADVSIDVPDIAAEAADPAVADVPAVVLEDIPAGAASLEAEPAAQVLPFEAPLPPPPRRPEPKRSKRSSNGKAS